MKKLNSAEFYKKSEYFKTHPMGLEKFFVNNSDYKQMLLSYRRDKVAFLFERKESEAAAKHELIVVDLESGNAVELVSELGESFVPFDVEILNFKWLENDEIEITIPNKYQVGSQSIVEWFKGENSDTAVMKLMSKRKVKVEN